MKLFLALVFFVADVVAGPTQCNVCDARDADTCSRIQRNQTCSTDRDSLGTTHCGSAAIKYLGFGDVIEHRIIRGCFNCTDKKAACFALGGYLKDDRWQTLLQCEIECCTASNCNTQMPTLSKDAITVFSPNASGPTQCYECRNDDPYSCNFRQTPQNCARDSRALGKTHCGSATIKYLDVSGVHDGVFRGCIDCADKKSACAAIGGYLKSDRSYTVLECEIECCTGNNCNDGDDGPGQCNTCVDQFGQLSSCTSGSPVQQNQTCLTDRSSLGTAHCGSVAIKYRDNSFGDSVKTGLIRGCLNCTDKKAACFAIGGYLKAERGQTLLQCEIECCNSSNCNNQNTTLAQDAITVFTPDAAGPSQCQECFDDDDATCIQRQDPQDCGRDSRSLGTTHCGHAKIKYASIFGIRDGVFRGCINCADKKAACAVISGFVKSRRTGLLLQCEIKCCTGNNCNDGAAGLPKCPSCSGRCSKKDSAQVCSLNPGFLSLGTTHCGSAVGKYRDRKGKVENLVYRGCFNCADKKAACFALGGLLKGILQATLLECEIDCCTGSNCNAPFPTESGNAIKVFTPAVAGPQKCNLCLENNATSCSKNQETHICATDSTSLGTSHCGSAVGRYQDSKGNVVNGFIRGCINCEDKKAACAALGGFLKVFRRWTQLECEIECCIGDNCNTQIPILSKGGDPTTNTETLTANTTPLSIKGGDSTPTTKSNAAAGRKNALFHGVLIFSTAIRVILYHI